MSPHSKRVMNFNPRILPFVVVFYIISLCVLCCVCVCVPTGLITPKSLKLVRKMDLETDRWIGGRTDRQTDGYPNFRISQNTAATAGTNSALRPMNTHRPGQQTDKPEPSLTTRRPSLGIRRGPARTCWLQTHLHRSVMRVAMWAAFVY